MLDALPIESGEAPENAMGKADRDRKLQAVVDALPAQQREFLLLHVGEGMKYKDIAQKHGVPYRIVLRQVARAYSTLRLKLNLKDL